MPRNRAVTRQAILQAAYDMFYRHGFARVGIDEIAEKAGVTKRTLYDHFRSKDDLLAEAMAQQHGAVLAQARTWGAAGGGTAADIIARMFAELDHWMATPRWSGAGFTRVVMELADLPGHPARAIARQHKAAIEQWLADEFAAGAPTDAARAQAQQLARAVMLLAEGAMALTLIHGSGGSYAADAAAIATSLIARRTIADEAATG